MDIIGNIMPLSPHGPAVDTLKKAKADLMQGWKNPKGTHCPCCTQKVKLYKRRIYSVPARELIALYRLDKGDGNYYHITKFCPVHVPVVSLMVHWGLVEQKANDDDAKTHSGLWRITPKGRLFAEGKITVIEHCFIYNKKTIMWGETRQNIRKALGKKFNYPELMGYLL